MPFENYGAGVYGPYYSAGAPDAGTDAIQTATFAGTWLAEETFTLAFDGYSTGPIDWTDTDGDLIDNINAALDDLPNGGTAWIVATDDSLTDGLGDVLLTFSGGDLSKKVVPLVTVAANTSVDGTLSIAEDTAGVTATYRDAQKGSILFDTDAGGKYIKTGDTGTGDYTLVGTQS